MLNVDPRNHTALCCFLLIARHFCFNLTLESIVHKYALQDFEVSLELLLRIVRENGFRAKEETLSWERLFKVGKAFPFILCLKDKKNVVISGVQQGEVNRVAILNPLDLHGGFKFFDKQGLEAVWEGKAIFIKRNFKLSDADQPFSLRWFLPEIIREKKLFRDVAISSFILNVLALGSPFFFQLVIDKVLVHKGFSTLQTLAIGMVILLIFDALFCYIKQTMLLYATNKIDMRLTRRVFSHLIYLPTSFFDSSSAGVLLKHVQQAEKIRGFLTGRLLFTLLDLSVLAVIFPIIFLYSITLSVVVLASAAVIAAILGFAMPVFKKRLHNLYLADGERQATLVEAIHGMPTIKALALEPLQSRTWDAQSAKTISMQFRVGKLSIFIQTLTDFINKVTSIIVLWVGVNLVFDNTLTVGSLIAFTMLSQRVSTPLVSFVSLLHQYQEVVLSIEMLGNVMNCPKERQMSARGLTPVIKGSICFEHVSFRYPHTSAYALRDVNLSIPAGALVGIVGRSGSGKSTLARLLLCLYPSQVGKITIDGMDIREIDLPHLRRSVSVVLQDNFLFCGTIRQNISNANPSASFEDIVYAAKLAGADEFIQGLKQGYDTPVFENGSNLSGGQRQRLSIARSLLANPSVMVFDEATSALDAESETIIQKNLKNIAKGRTMLIISHRLSMIADCDAIVVVDRGSIVAVGKHKKLLSSCKLYRELWEAQNRHLIPTDKPPPLAV